MIKELKAAAFAVFLWTCQSSATAAGTCSGRVMNPVTDVCWSCVFPIKIAGAVPLGASSLPDPHLDVPPACVCASGVQSRIGVSVSFYEPIRTVEIVRHPGCLPTMGGIKLELPGIQAGSHTTTSSKTGDGSMRRHTAFWQVHWFNTPWLFILEALLDADCLEKTPWDLAYLSELDPLWDDTLASFILAPEAALFANPAAQGACAADCIAANLGLPRNELYWCAGCSGSVFPLNGWTSSAVSRPSAWQLMTQRFAMKLAREGLLRSAHGHNGLCGSYFQPIIRKDVWRTQFIYPSRSSVCSPFGKSTAISGSGKAFSPGGEDGAILLFRRRDCCAGVSAVSAF